MTTSLQDGTMVDKIAQFDLPKEMADSEQKKPWPSGIYAKTLFKKHDLRVVLISMQNCRPHEGASRRRHPLHPGPQRAPPRLSERQTARLCPPVPSSPSDTPSGTMLKPKATPHSY